MLVPPRETAPRITRWWVDYVLIAAAAIWWAADRSAEPVILSMSAVYSIAVGAGATTRACVRRLIESGSHRPIRAGVRWLLLGIGGLALIGAAVLALPRCWQGWYPVMWESTYWGQASYDLLDHVLDCLFTATAAVTGTGLAVFDVGGQFSRTGQIVILVLMQVGGFVVLITGAVVGWRLRGMISWQGGDDDTSPVGLRRLVGFVCVATVLIEAAGAAVLFFYPMTGGAQVSYLCQDRMFDAVFHSVSAFCNVGLTLPRNSLIGCSPASVYGAILPLMVLGGIGGPAGYELCRRLIRHGGHGLRALSKDGWVTLAATALLIVIGAGLLLGIESTYRWQLGYQRDDTPGKAGALAEEQPSGAAVFSSEGGTRTQAERIRTMTPGRRSGAAVVYSISARTGGMRSARLDRLSLSPASRVVLMAEMLIGGAVGGTAGGLRILVVILLAGAVGKYGLRSSSRQRVITAAAGVAASMLVLIGLVTFVLVYRQAGEDGSMEAGLFEAVSACCNVGFSTGLTRQIAELKPVDRLPSQLALMIGMLLGRVLPLGILLRCSMSSDDNR